MVFFVELIFFICFLLFIFNILFISIAKTQNTQNLVCKIHIQFSDQPRDNKKKQYNRQIQNKNEVTQNTRQDQKILITGNSAFLKFLRVTSKGVAQTPPY